MHKTLVIAWREFVATVATKGFLVGLLIPPVMLGLVAVLLPLLMNQASPRVAGRVAVIDESGRVAPLLERAFSEEMLRQRRDAKLQEAREVAKDTMGVDLPNTPPQAAGMAQSMGPSVSLRVEVLPEGSSEEAAKEEIKKATGREQGGTGQEAMLALIRIPGASVQAEAPGAAARGYAPYTLFVAPKLDPEIQNDIREQTDRAIIDARLGLAGYDVAATRELLRRPSSEIKAVTQDGEQKANQAAAFLVPGAFMLLLWIATFTAGQYLLSGTIEEKSNRVMEVLLSAASPMQLMVGKIIGKGAVGALLLLLYGGAGILALVAFALSYLIQWHTLGLVAVYFVLAYVTIACMMSAVGAAVTEITEAQSLLGPIMMVLVIPMMLWLPILRNPNSGFAQVCSFLPLINPFVMVLRICGSEPIPAWQIPVSILVGVVTVWFMAWISAKIFRIGVLMYGKPPNFATLIRWVRMA